MNIENLKPKQLWENFSSICKIPHPSEHEEKLRDYLKKLADDLSLETLVDAAGNLIIRKPATPGMENGKGVILQAHLDMVPHAESGITHDFLKDPIQTEIVGDWVKAKGTTLGADNGIGVAAIMAVMQDKNLQHGPLEALLTVTEETSMTGAFGLQPHVLKGEILLNLDNYMDNIVIGSAGGTHTNIKMKYTKDFIPADSVAIKVTITGLKGGHSAGDIHLPRGNAIKIMTHLLLEAGEKYPIAIADITSGTVHNAIPSYAEATIVVPKLHGKDFLKLANETADYIKDKLKVIKTGIKTSAVEVEMPDHVLDPEFQKNLLFTLYLVPSGLLGMSVEIPGLVETSTNLAAIKFDHEAAEVEIKTFQRSSVEFVKKDVTCAVTKLFKFFNAEVTKGLDFSAWTPNTQSPILNLTKKMYEKIHGKNPEISATHGGLETGVFMSNYPYLDMVSIGPTIQNEHTSVEQVNITSVEKFWNLLVAILENIKDI